MELLLPTEESNGVQAMDLLSPTEESYGVPVIDFSKLRDPAKRASICAQVRRASETMGFFEVVNASFPVEAMEEAFDTCRDFFDLPVDTKTAFKQEFDRKSGPPAAFPLGYHYRFAAGSVKSHMEVIVFRHYPYEQNHNEDTEKSWPTNPQEFRPKMEMMMTELGKLADDLFDVFSGALGLPETFLREQHYKNTTVPRYNNINFYPRASKTEEQDVAFVPHRDTTIFTLVAQNNEAHGLQINPYGEWIACTPTRGGVVVNVGDILEVWSNGRFKSILHRVISNKEHNRYSMAYFVRPTSGPREDMIIEPIPRLITKDSPAKYSPFSFLKFFKNKGFSQTDLVSLINSHKIGTPTS